jgi:hypothetical protein
VSNFSEPLIPYRVVYSERARQRLRLLSARAARAGLGPQFLEAVKELDQRLRLYPQFGEPLFDLTAEPGAIRVGVIVPLVVRYAVHEERRLVMVAAPPRLLPRSGI